MTDELVDVLIVGAGPSGAATAWSLSKTNLSIMCLEQGDWMDPAGYPSTQTNWETGDKSTYHVSPNIRNRAEDYPINDNDSPIAVANFNAVGGGTILYSGHFPRFHPSDFRVKTLDGVADDWPLGYANLEPFFHQNDRMMGVSGLAGDPAYPTGPAPPGGHPVALGRMGETIAKGFNKLGWHWWPSYSAIITGRPYKGRQPCVNLGPCNRGCAQGAKGSVDITYWPVAIKNGVQLKTHARVREITIDNSGKTTGVIYYDKHGCECRQSARIVILACNGIGTPRILLNSRSKRFPDGLANRSGLVGKNLMLHPWGYIEGLFEDPLDSHLGPQGCSLFSHQFYETDKSRGFDRGYTMQVLRGAGPVETALAGLSRRQIPWGNNHHKAFAEHFDHTVGMAIIVEDLPELDNTVTLDPILTDSNDIPAPRIKYRLSDNSRKMLGHGLTKGKEVMTAAGSLKNIAFGPVRQTGWHLMGTARMGNDPSKSVTNKHGQSHDVKNLFIVDSSIFVTSSGVNPVSTMQALALYIAENIKQNLTKLLDE